MRKAFNIEKSKISNSKFQNPTIYTASIPHANPDFIRKKLILKLKKIFYTFAILSRNVRQQFK